jgi:protein-L-isoaspartate(D-aspartate) O-methyltransferase
MTKYDLIDKLKRDGILKSFAVEQALLEIDRSDFVLPENKANPYIDTPLSIGYGQTISQPLTVVFMLELLNIQQGNKIMDVGTGSGWMASLIAFLSGEGGKVHTVEIIDRLSEYAQENALKYPILKEQLVFHIGNATKGLQQVSEEYGGFDRIIAAAEVKEIPQAWKEQLKVGGIMVFPKDKGIYKLTKNNDTDFDSLFFPGFAFVPFVED